MEEFLEVHKALSHPIRLRILGLLGRDLCVGALARTLEMSEGSVSRHLGQLRNAGLVTGEKRGYWTHYRVETSRLREAAQALEGQAESLSGPQRTECRRGPGCPMASSLCREGRDPVEGH